MNHIHQKRFLEFTGVMFCFMCIIIYTVWNFNDRTTTLGLDAARQELRSEAAANGHVIQTEYTNMTNSLSLLADAISRPTDFHQTKNDTHLRLFADQLRFDQIGISDAYGNAVDSDGQEVYIGDREYFKKAMKGEIAVSDMLHSKVIPSRDVQVMAVPILKDDTPQGVVFGILDIQMVLDSLKNMKENPIYTQIVDSNGIPITHLKTDTWMLGAKNIWDYYKQCKFVNGNAEKIKEDMLSHQSGYYTVECKGENRITYYAPLGIGGYYIFSNLGFSPLKNIMDQIKRNARQMALGIAIAFFFLTFCIYLFNKKISEELKESYKVRLSSEEILRIAASHSNALVFEYHIRGQLLIRKTEEENLLFSEEIIHNVPDSILQKGILDKESEALFIDAFTKIREEEKVSVTVKVVSEQQHFWYQILMNNIYDESHQIINTVGAVSDITELKQKEEMVQEEKRRKEEFQEKAERDGLTGLYNGSTANEKINQFLHSPQAAQGKHILVFMDLDNFKKINDTFGHQFGNQVLIDIAQILTHKFRHDDIIVRFGGDEFAVFLKNTMGFEKLEHVFEELIHLCNITYEKDGKKVSISASFGISVAPDHGTSFEELSDKADQMLYEVKRSHKNGFRLYQQPESK